ncbi:MAG TPA: MauE/DoxX family redox-associated membrane protein [Candidatus Acidoferrales bacterium]|nr:MauE/DoxX family redox-associated membrane protein [Candidatus Acidoferrales bacterium]
MAGLRQSRFGALGLLAGRLILAGIFLLAAYGKLLPQGAQPWTLASLRLSRSSLNLSMTFFAMQIDSYQMLPGWAVVALAHTLPWVELGLGMLLLAGVALPWTGTGATALLALLLAVVSRSYLMGLQINCGCFGPSEPLTRWTIIRDGLFLALGLAVTAGAFLRARGTRGLETAASGGAAEGAPANS